MVFLELFSNIIRLDLDAYIKLITPVKFILNQNQTRPYTKKLIFIN